MSYTAASPLPSWHRPHWRTTLLLALLVPLTGCDTLGGAGLRQKPHQVRIQGQLQGSSEGQLDPRLAGNNSARFFSRSGARACLGAATAAVLACQFSGTRNKESCMVRAGLLACGIAMGTNYYLDNKRAQYANAEDRLDSVIADVRKDNQELQALSDTARQVIEDDRRTLEQLDQDIASGQVQRDRAQRQLASIDLNADYLKTTLDNVRKKREQWQEVAAAERRSQGARLDLLNAEIARMAQRESELQEQLDQLYAQRSAIRLGDAA